MFISQKQNKSGEKWGKTCTCEKKAVILHQNSKNMNTFLGNTEVKLDDKGRIFIPANFRKILAEMESKRIIVRRDTDNECLIFYPEPTWNTKVAALRDALDEWNPDDQLILMQFMAEAEILEMDGQGRVLLNKKSLPSEGNAMMFVGMLDRFALWEPKNFEEKKMSQVDLATNIRQRMARK